MKIDLRWLKNRLSVMTRREIQFRIARLIQFNIEKLLHKSPVKFSNSVPVDYKGRDLFLKQTSMMASSTDGSCAENIALDRLLTNKIALFEQSQYLSIGNPISWLVDPKTKVRSPTKFGKSIDYRDDALVGDVKYLWEFGRQQYLVPLTVDYLITNDQKLYAKLGEFLDSWLKQNKIGTGIHWCSSLEVSLRLISWSVIHSMLKATSNNDGLFGAVADATLLKQVIQAQVKFVMRNLSWHSSANNHLVGELVGVWTACHVFDLGTQGVRYSSVVKKALEDQANLQNHEDGVNKEQAIYYHFWVLEYLWLAWSVGKRCEDAFSKNFEQILINMTVYLKCMCPGALIPANIGDADGGQVVRFSHELSKNPFSELSETIDSLLDKRNLSESELKLARNNSLTVHSKAYWYSRMLDGIDLESIRSRYVQALDACDQYPQSFPKGGMYLLGDKRALITFKAGPLGYLSTAAHGHADALSVTLALDDKWWLTDQGTYSYHSHQKWRDYFRGTSAHNTVVVNKTNQSTIGGDFLWTHKAECCVLRQPNSKAQIVSAYHDGYEPLGATHRRTVKYSDDTAEIQDQIDLKPKSGAAALDLYFHFHPDVHIVQKKPDEVVASRASSSVQLTLMLPPQMSWTVTAGQENPELAGWYSDKYDSKEPCSTLCGSLNTNKPRSTLVTHMKWSY